MTHIMLDLETLSTRTNARVLAIGAVKFIPEKEDIYDRFYQVVAGSNDSELFHISDDTIKWWAKQSAEAQAVFTDPSAVPIETALKLFADWVAPSATEKEDVFMWGNGAAFDNAILSTAYALCEIEQPWIYWNDRCYRTMKSLNRNVPFARLGTHHNALADAESQAAHLMQIFGSNK